MIKLVVFDLDGTLADTLYDLATAMNAALSSEGLPVYPIEDYRHFVGNGIDNLVKVTMAQAYTPDGAKRVKEGFNAYYADHCTDGTAVYEGVDRLLGQLTEDGILTAVISNKPNRFVPRILQKLYPDRCFLHAWGQRDGIARKPDPQSLVQLITLCSLQKHEVLYVGDSNVDVMFGHNAGVKVCGVSWGFRGAEELREAGADYIVNSTEELYKIVSHE